MPPLYPKMRERPPGFRINPAWPYHWSIAFACLPSPRFGLRQNDRSPYEKAATPASGVTASNVRCDPKLARFTVASDNNTQYWSYGTGRLSITTEFTVCAFGRIFGTPSAYTRLVSKHGTQYGFTTAVNGASGSLAPPFLGFSTNGSDWNYAFAGTDVIAQPYAWRHYAFIRSTNIGRLYLNGTEYVGGDFPATTFPTGSVFQSAQQIRVCSDERVGAQPFQAAEYTDVMVLNTALSAATIEQLADPSNVDLRIGGIPLILPPRRRFWSVVSEQAIPKMIPWHLFQQVGA